MDHSEVKRISVTIIAQNEEQRIAKAVVSCQDFADEIVVVDGGSKDATVEIAESLGCKVFFNPWPGFAKQRNFAAEKATHDWIFFIDTDEFANEELKNAIKQWKAGKTADADIYNIYRIGNFMGKWLDKGENLPRMYNRKVTSIKETEVHEGPEPEGRKIGFMPGILWHDGYRSIDDHVIRFNKYTALEAQKALSANQSFSLMRLLFRPALRFGQKYFVHGLFKKGLAGLTVATLWAYYEYLTQIKLYELKRVQNSGVAE
ncbi:glycosyltransferase family 2 protein [Paenibacillus elgii]|uniref:glycosyltransferase family 2 protein n=1 Tax=Paenibacillus elgii TaxID=189691 RepID=UPI000248C392|nr:glycosyltransferase family 2 protein [Paenibacillus elgii]